MADAKKAPPLTNRLGLPAALGVALEKIRAAHTPSGADATVTELVGSARIGALRRAHKHEVVEDVADNIWSLWGQMVHKILEEAGRDLPDTLTEHMLWTEVRGWRVCGVLDTHSLIDGRLSDWKVSSWYGFKDGPKDEWEAQLNVLALMLADAGHEVREVEIIPLVRDHGDAEANRKEAEGYPPQPITRIPCRLWPLDETRAYLDTRVDLHQKARLSLEAGALPKCTRAERWQKPETWAVMKNGNVRSSKNCKSHSEALAVIGDAPNFHIDYRPGIARRCQGTRANPNAYCSIRPWCEALNDSQFSPGDLEVSDDA